MSVVKGFVALAVCLSLLAPASFAAGEEIAVRVLAHLPCPQACRSPTQKRSSS